MTSAIESITVGVTSIASALTLFRDLMHLKTETSFEASPSLLRAWGVAPRTHARIVELSCDGYPMGRLRLVEYSPGAMDKVRSHSGPSPHDHALDIGPKAIDFYVHPPMRRWYDAIVAAGYPTRAEPVTHEVQDSISEEFVFWGPDGVPLLLMVGHRHPANQMRAVPAFLPFSEVATISVVGGDIEATRRFYEGALGLDAVVDTETAPEFREQANRLTGVPPETRTQWLLYAQPGEPSGKILVVTFSPAQGQRLRGRMRPGRLGFSLMTHFAEDLDVLHGRLVVAGSTIITPPTEVEWRDATRRVMLAEGPNEELFEFVERAPATRQGG